MSGIASGAGAIGSHQSQSAAAAASNSQKKKQWERQLQQRDLEWNQSLNKWNARRSDYTQNLRATGSALGRAYAAEDMKMDEQIDKLMFKKQESIGKLFDAQGKQAVKGLTGKTARRLNNSSLAQFGRQQAMAVESLASSQWAMEARNEHFREKAKVDQRNLHNKVAFAPQPGVDPVKPVATQGPSGLSLVAGLAQAGLSAYGGYQDSLKIPGGGSLPGGGNFSMMDPGTMPEVDFGAIG